MTEPHLFKIDAVYRAFDAVIILASAQTVPHGFNRRVDYGRSPVGIAVVGHNAPEMLIFFVFVFDGALQPVFAVQIEDNPALIEAVVAFLEFCLYDEAEVFFIRFHLIDRRVVILKMIVGSLPQIRMRLRHDFDASVILAEFQRFSRPFKFNWLRKFSSDLFLFKQVVNFSLSFFLMNSV